ncbi:MAG: response regulator [Deltaproteobacteria bacterium]|nr:response regulator [Deltaproteobacteria bacterium]
MKANPQKSSHPILIVESDAAASATLKSFLEEAGFQVEWVTKGEAALQRIAERKPQLVISSTVLEDQDGYTLCEQIKKSREFSEIPVALITSLKGPEDLIRALQCGADHFIRPQWTKESLFSSIETILGHRELGELRKKEKIQVGIEMELGGRPYFITAERRQILDLLVTTYEEVLRLNDDLKKREMDLEQLNKMLEKKVEERTLSLREEMAERHRLEEQLIQAQKMEAIGRLAGGIAHAFNNLLTVVQGCAELLLKDLTESREPSRSDVEEIVRAVKQAGALTSQLLSFSRRQVIRPEVVDLNAIVVRMSDMMKRFIGEDIEIVMDLDQNLAFTKVDVGQMEQVLLNLTVNARDSMPTGGRLMIETTNTPLGDDYAGQHYGVVPGDYICLSISDTGPGLSEEIKDHLFEPFFTLQQGGKSTGLGLATCYGIVKQAGGHIWWTSERGKGTIFKIYLPQTREVRIPPRKPKEGQVLPQGRERILLVEDAPSVRSLTERILRDLGYEVIVAANGREALRLAETEKNRGFDLLLTDVVMPEINGKDLALQIRKIFQNIRVIFTSGFSDNIILSRGMLDPRFEFLRKPFTLQELAEKVRAVLDTKLAA